MIPEDPRLRIVTAFAVVLCLSQLRHLGVAAAALVVVAGFARVCGHPMGRRLWHVEGFVALLFVTMPFSVPGEPLFAIGPLHASREGVLRAAVLGCKISAAVVVMRVLLAPLDPARLGAALHGLRLPEPLVRVFALTPRYLGLIRDEARRLTEAMRARGFRPGTNRHSWRSYGYLVGMLVLRALARARRVEEAMLCRGFSGRFPHAALARPGWRDWAGAGLLTGMAALAWGIDRA